MLKNYELLQSGIVRQKKIKKSLSAQTDYLKHYKNIENKVDKMSFLRLGYLFGVINKPFSLLDIDYMTGSFLKQASAVIPNCYGYDLDNNPLPENAIRVNNCNTRYYDVITLFDTLEHYTNLDFISKLRCTYIVITVPECHDAADTEWFISWKHRRPDENIYHFSKIALTKFMAMSGYIAVSISNIEDIIRGNLNGKSNILTGIFKKIDLDKNR